MKVLIVGSGPIVIGQAAEFDYAGTQACRSLREEGVETILVNSNPATIMTDEGVADTTYLEPLTVDVLERIIARERPDGLLATLGGQTGLNLSVALDDAGILAKYGVRILGTPLRAIRQAEDREAFKRMLLAIGEPVPDSVTATNVAQAVAFASVVGYPLVIRPAYTLGGTGGGIASNEGELRARSAAGLAASPIGQVLVERSLVGWKEIEYEVLRDRADTCVTVCNMENVDPMGIHTGDSIVVAPSQTLSDKEHQLLRTAAIKIIRALGIEGGCNVQFAYDPACTPEAATTRRSPYYVIEVNPRVSRSSALASKATGYPIARVAAKIAVGRRLDEITNAVTRKTTAAFEPALDYVVVKIPRWPFDKFPSADRSLGTQMKATGEVMAIERSFEAALQKAVRSLELKGPGFYSASSRRVDELIGALTPASDERLGAIFAAFGGGATVDQVRRATGIDPWFLRRIEGLVRFADADLRGATPSRALLWRAKRLGFSDADLGALLGRTSDEVRTLRTSFGIRPVYKMVDTCAAEFEAATPYFYSTYEDENEAEPLAGPKCVVLGAGPIRIGQGIEFDCCAVQAAQALQDAGVKSIMINSNPETVSTDFDASARLYFEPLDEESVAAVLQNEGVAESALVGSAGLPVLAQFGGQTALDLSDRVAEYGGLLAGTSAAAIAVAEDRRLFHEMCERLGIAQPQGGLARDLVGAYETARSLGYPVLVRPSYVLGGRAMDIARDERGLERIFSLASQAGRGEVLIDKYIEGLEVEVDAVSDGVDTLVAGIMEHVERAGIHSGDSFAVYPPRNLLPADVRTILTYTSSIATALPVRGLLNIQFIVRGETVYVLEANTRASRTVPFLTKVTGVPLVRLAVEVALGASLRELGYEGGLWPSGDLVAVKAPVFSTGKLAAVDARLGPEMRSTGEVIGAGRSYASALWKALLAAGVAPAPEGAVLVAIGDSDREQAATVIDGFYWLGYELIAAPATAEYVRSLGLPVREVTEPVNASFGGWTFGRPEADAGLSLVGLVQAGRCALVINTAHGEGARDEDFAIRRAAVERGVPCFSSLDTAAAVLAALRGSALDSAMRRFSDYRRSPPAHRAVA